MYVWLSDLLHVDIDDCIDFNFKTLCGYGCYIVSHYRSPTPDLLSEDMRRERERRQWELEAEDELEQDKPVGPVHYQELRAGEVRTHGTAYYAFSKDEEQRREQLGLLNKLREQVWRVSIV